MMAYLAAFFDTNVILDVLLERRPWFAKAAVLWGAARHHTISCYASASSITDIYYISSQVLRRNPIPGRDARLVIRQCLDHLTIIGVSDYELERAYEIGGKDFEDDLQRACAEFRLVDAIVTRDPDGFRGTEIPVFSPDAFVDHLIRMGTIPDPGLPRPTEGPTP